MPARPWGQRIGSNDKHNEWKLFIGQVPLEVRAWLALFCPAGMAHISWLYMVFACICCAPDGQGLAIERGWVPS